MAKGIRLDLLVQTEKEDNKEKKELTFQADDLNDHHTGLIIENMFTVFGLQPVLKEATLMPAAMEVAATAVAPLKVLPGGEFDPYKAQAVPKQAIEETKKVHEDRQAPLEKKKVQDYSRPRQLPYVNESRTTFPLAEHPEAKKLLDAAEKIVEQTTPEHINTGVKVINIGGETVNTYRCHYHCPNCHHVGRRYIRPESRYAKCHMCDTKLKVTPATDKPLTPDEENNFFLADREYEWRG